MANLVEELLKINSEHEFVFFEDARYEYFNYVKQSSRVTHNKFSMKGDRFFLWEQVKLPMEIRKSGVDIFHSPGNTQPLIQPCSLVVTLHDTLLMDSAEDETPNFLFYTRHILPIGLKRCKKIITVSENSKKDIMRKFRVPDEKIEVIYHGIDPFFRRIDYTLTANEIKTRLGIRGKFFFTIGSLGPRKNTQRVIETFSLLKKEKNIEHQLIIGGLKDGAESIFRKQIEAKGLDKDIILISYISNTDLLFLYNNADIFYYISLYEGFGFPALEAMACGCPLIASNISSLPELVADSRILVDPIDINDIFDKSWLILSNRIFKEQIVEKGLRRVKQFTWRSTAEHTLKVYESVVH